MARVTRRTKPARSSRGSNSTRPSIRAHMTRRMGIQSSRGINGSPHGTSSQRGRSGKTVERDVGRKPRGKAGIDRRKRFGQF